MPALQTPFNAMNFDPEMGGARLPVGPKQPVRIIESEIKAARENGNNGYVRFSVEVLDGPNKGAVGDIRHNIYNSNGDAARIAMNQLAAMSIAAGLPMWQNTEELHSRPFLIDVTKQVVKDGQENKGYTEVSAYYDLNGNKPKRGGVSNQAQTQNNQQQGQGQGQAQSNWNNNQQQNGGGQQQTQNPNVQSGIDPNAQQQNQAQQGGGQQNGGNWNQQQGAQQDQGQQQNWNQQQGQQGGGQQGAQQSPPWNRQG